MRSALIILCTIAVIALAFGGYLMVQKAAPRRSLPKALDARAVQPATAPANPNLPVTSGENVFVETYDKNTNQLASRFRAAQYDPQPDGSTVNVTKPEAEFYLDNGNGRVIRLRGVDGQVVVPKTPGTTATGGRSQMPTRGKLRDVILMLYPTKSAKHPTLTCRMNNASFDTDTFRITTEAFTDATTGREVPADQVPVQVRGDDYDFDGKGLTIHWDEKDRRLQLLEIAHGQRLLIKKPGAFGAGASGGGASGGGTPSPSPRIPGEGRGEGPPSERLQDSAVASLDKSAPLPPPTTRRHRPTAGTTTQPSSPARSKLRSKATTRPARPTTSSLATTKPAHPPAPYRAVFYDNVRVMQGDQQVAQADLMNVDFLMNEEGGAQSSTTQESPTTAPTTPTTKRSGTARKGQQRPATSPAPATQAATAPTTQPLPLTVLWTGKLRVTPPPPGVEEVAPGDSAVEFVSEKNPVLLHWQGSNVVCASAQWHTLDDSAIVRSSDLVPIIKMDDPRGFTLLTPSLDYSGADHIAVTEGKSHAEFPLQRQQNAPATQPADIARVDWTDACTMLMSPGKTKDDLAIEHIRLDGEVVVDSSQLKLRSHQLDVLLDPEAQRKKPDQPASAPNAAPSPTEMAVKQVIATDSVHAVVTDEQKKQQTIDCQRLACDLDKAADGRAFLRLLNADGDVHTVSADGELTCGHLDATLMPSTQPSSASAAASAPASTTQPVAVLNDVIVPTTAPTTSPLANADFSQMQIETLYASQNVRGRTSDGRLIEGDRVKLTQTDAGPQYQISAALPAGPATDPVTTAPTTNPASLARVSDGTNTLVGPNIILTPRIGKADVIGEGAMHGVQQQAARQPGEKPATQPIDVTWKQQLNADMRANQVRITGDVVATSKLDDGSTNVARGALLVMDLADAPAATQPTTQPAAGLAGAGQPAAGQAAGQAATQPSKHRRERASTGPTTSPTNSMLAGADFELFRNKVVRTVRLSSDQQVEVRSTLLGADGSLQRRINLFAPLLIYEMETRALLVPSPGRLLYQDERGASTQPGPATASAATQPVGPLGDTKGAMAFQWNKDFQYDETERTATMRGDVLLVHQTPAGAEAYRMNAQQVVAQMQPPEDKPKTKSAAATKPATKPATDPAAGAKIKRLVADNQIVFVSQRLQFQADHIEFDPTSQQLYARGAGPNAPAVLLDTNGLSQGTFSELYYDTARDQMRMVNFRAAVRK